MLGPVPVVVRAQQSTACNAPSDPLQRVHPHHELCGVSERQYHAATGPGVLREGYRRHLMTGATGL